MKDAMPVATSAVPVLLALCLSGCDYVPWHRFIVPNPSPSLLHTQYSNVACGAFPTENGEVIVEYDAQGCASTSAKMNGPKWNPGTAWWQRNSSGDLVPLSPNKYEWCNSWIIGTGGERISVSTHRQEKPGREPLHLYLFLTQCAHLPGVGELRKNKDLMAYVQSTLDESEADATAPQNVEPNAPR